MPPHQSDGSSARTARAVTLAVARDQLCEVA